MGVSAGPHYIDDTLTFTAITHRFDTGALTDADAVPAYRIYEDETGTAILTGNTAKLDDTNTTGFYSEQITLSAANGFEVGKSYSIYVSAAVNSVTGGQTFNFKVIATPSAAPSAATIADAVWDEDATGHQTQGSFGQVLGDSGSDSDTLWALANTNLDAAVSTRMATYTQPTGFLAANFPSDPADQSLIIAATDAITAAIAALNNLSAAQVNAEVDTALADINLDHLVKIAVDTDFPTTVHLGSVIGQLADNGTTATFDRTTDSLEAIRDRGDAAWITATGFSTHAAADVWAVGTRVLTAGTNIVLAKGTGITGFNDLSAAQVNTEADTALSDVGVTTTVTGRIDAAISSRMATYTQPTGFLAATFPSDPADQSLVIAATDALATLIDALPTNSELATALGTADDAVLTQIAAVKAKTDLIPGTQDGKTFAELVLLMAAVLLGKGSGLGTNTGIYRAVDDSKARVTATIDADGNRSAVTLDAS